MNKELEQLLIVGVLGATAFVLWRAYRNGKSLGALGNLTGATATEIANNKAQFQRALVPKADSLIDSIWGNNSGSGSGGGSGTGPVDGVAQYVNGPSGLIDVSTLPPI